MAAQSGLRIAISGAGGFLGSALVESLVAEGATVLRLVRRPGTGPGEIHWDPDHDTIDAAALEGVDAVVHLAGESIVGPWTAVKKRKIFDSRSAGTRLLSNAISRLGTPPKVFISASATGYYGNAGEATLTEQDPPGDDFLARVCVAWEDATASAVHTGMRVVTPRFGLVMDPSGGALAKMLPPFRLGLGARLGNGRQWMSWISLTDAVRVIRYCLEAQDLDGPVNTVSPDPIRNSELTRSLARALHRPAFLRAPAFILKAATAGMADALLLTSQRVLPEVLMARGFTFVDPTFDAFLSRRLGWTPDGP